MTTRPVVIPPWLAFAIRQDGLREIPGEKHNPRILEWARELGPKVLGITVVDDETPWCGLFAAACFRRSVPAEPLPKIAVRAKSWSSFGVPLDVPAVGSVLVFSRKGGGHVGFYLGEDADCFHVFGGNQDNAVRRSRIEKARLSAVRWPSTAAMPASGRRFLSPSGAVSLNES